MVKYTIDGWCILLPEEWTPSVDRESGQIIFDTEEGATLYLSVKNFGRPETGEKADAQTVGSIVLRAFESQGMKRWKGFSRHYPEGFPTYMGKGITTDGYPIVACAVCTVGSAFLFYVVGDSGTDLEEYVQYIKWIEWI